MNRFPDKIITPESTRRLMKPHARKQTVRLLVCQQNIEKGKSYGKTISTDNLKPNQGK